MKYEDFDWQVGILSAIGTAIVFYGITNIVLFGFVFLFGFYAILSLELLLISAGVSSVLTSLFVYRLYNRILKTSRAKIWYFSSVLIALLAGFWILYV